MREALDAEIAEFRVHDIGFRGAIDSAVDEERLKIFEILNSSGQNGNDLDYAIGQLISLGGKSEARKKLLAFLQSLRQSVDRSERKDEEVKDYSMTREEQMKKEEAKALYKQKRYQEAIEIVLQLFSNNPRLMQNPSMVGLLLHCYDKADDWPRVFEWGEKYLELDDMPRISNVAVVIKAAYFLNKYGEVMDFVKRYPQYDSDHDISHSASIAAYRLGRYEEALKFATRHIAYNGEFRFILYLEIVEAALGSVVRLKKEPEEILRWCKVFLKQKEELYVLKLAENASRRLGKTDEANEYLGKYEKLLVEAEERLTRM
ncbi:MAG: hypothetical protein AAB739_05515 [Patescibacteria group bacterium]|mgnify:FL=1